MEMVRFMLVESSRLVERVTIHGDGKIHAGRVVTFGCLEIFDSLRCLSDGKSVGHRKMSHSLSKSVRHFS